MRIKSLILALVMILSVAAVPTVTLAADDTYILLLSENFTLPAGAPENEWKIATDAASYSNALRPNYVRSGKTNDKPATASFYVGQAGDYYVMANMAEFSAGFGNRHALIGIDGDKDSHNFRSEVPDGWEWSKSTRAYYLEPGYHTLQLYCGYASMCCAAVLITNDAGYTLTADTPLSSIESYADTQAPTIDGTIQVSRDSFTQMTVAFPNAADSKPGLRVKYTLDGKELDNVVGSSCEITVLKPLHTYEVTMTATDAMGNVTATTQEVTMGRWKLGSYSSTMAASVASVTFDINHLETVTNTASLFAAVYKKTANTMIVYDEVPVSATGICTISKTAALTLPQSVIDNPDDYVIKAFLTDSAEIMNAQTSALVIPVQEVIQ